MYQPCEIEGGDRSSHYLIVCDHATNIVPPSVNGGSLGLPEADMARHIAYDIGAEGVARALAARLDAPLILSRVALCLGEALPAPVATSNFSRLVIDPNRGEDDPTLVMKLYDGSIIPGNRHADEAEVANRMDAFWRPYHGSLGALIAARGKPVIVSIHSFTPQLAGRPPRPWHVGILSSGDRRLADPLLTRLAADRTLSVGDNEPYSGHLPGDTMDRHAVRTGRPHALIELRNDLIGGTQEQRAWAGRLAPALDDALAAADL